MSTDRSSVQNDRWARPFLAVIAVLCVAAGLYRFRHQYVNGIPPDQDLLFFFLAAAAVLLAESITKFKFGGMEFERVKALEARVDELAEVSRTDATAGTPGSRPTAPSEASLVAESPFDSVVAEAGRLYRPGLDWNDDPVRTLQAPSTRGGSTLAAVVTASSNYSQHFRIEAVLRIGREVATDPGSRAAFLLHHSFGEPVRIMPVSDRRCALTLIASGSFTLGAVLPDGSTLALDLVDADLGALTAAQRLTFINS